VTVEIKDKVYRQIKMYCDLNQLDINGYIESLVQKLVTANIYGEVPDFVKLHETKKEEKEERKSQKEIETLKKDIEEKDNIINNLQKEIKELENRKPVEIIKEVIKEVVKEVEVIKEAPEMSVNLPKKEEQPLKYDFAKFISSETTYEEEPEDKKVSVKPRKRKLN
jgi:septal ring factor EnvC (AmiA/AmiB activator)